MTTTPMVELNDTLLSAMGLNPEARAIIMEKCINRDKAEMQMLSDRVDNLRVATMDLDALYKQAQADVAAGLLREGIMATALEAIAKGKEPIAAGMAKDVLAVLGKPVVDEPAPEVVNVRG